MKNLAKLYHKIVPQVYNADEAKALHQERIRLLHVQQDLVKLVKANDNIKELLSIKKELAELREELPSTWLDGLKKITAKIKHVFVNTPEQILKDNITHNNEILKRVDKGLDITGKNIKDSTVARTNKLLEKLKKLEDRDILKIRSDKVEALRNELETTFISAVTASQPLSISQDLPQSQTMSSSIPERITPTRPVPPPLPPTVNIPPPSPTEGLHANQRAAGNAMAAPPPPPPPPPAVEPTAGQAQKAAAVVTLKGQGGREGRLICRN